LGACAATIINVKQWDAKHRLVAMKGRGISCAELRCLQSSILESDSNHCGINQNRICLNLASTDRARLYFSHILCRSGTRHWLLAKDLYISQLRLNIHLILQPHIHSEIISSVNTPLKDAAPTCCPLQQPPPFRTQAWFEFTEQMQLRNRRERISGKVTLSKADFDNFAIATMG
jgi:hypothetical protein